MKRRGVTVLIGLIAMRVAVLHTVSAEASTFHVSGVVLREGTNVPVPRCHLVMRLENQRSDRRRPGQDTVSQPAELIAETDSRGRFAIDLPSEGHWQLSATAVGFRPQRLNEHEGFWSAVVVHDGLSPPELTFFLEPDSTISGTVHDEAGEAVRNAVILLETVDRGEASGAYHQRAMTDDRGRYELSGVRPGKYTVSVQATPWYTAGPNHMGGQRPITDSAFDVVYPVTWYPGVFDANVAGTLNVQSGEASQVDFNLRPIPAGHLRVAGNGSVSKNPAPMPSIERIENGTPTGVASAVSTVGGQTEFGGLSPGLYRITTFQGDGHAKTVFVQVTAGATISLGGTDTAGTTDVTCRFAGEEKGLRTQVVLTDVATGAIFSSASDGWFGLRRRAQPAPDSPGGGANERHMAVPAGRYEVAIAGGSDLYLTSVVLGDKPLAGRTVQLSGGAANLTLHVARGRASLTGHALLDGRPVAGAMIMLVPASAGQAGSLDLLRRDQSNTDGSYQLEDIVPGDYILLAIDRGWQINWHDPATLDRYLLRGIPLSLPPRSKSEQEIRAQSP